MARITVEDCITTIPNRFDLVVLAAQLTKQIEAGLPLNVDRDNDKNPVIALREIAEGHANPDAIRESLIKLHRQYVQAEAQEEELEDSLEQELAGMQYISDAHRIQVTEDMNEDGDDDMADDFENSAEKDSSVHEDTDIVDE